MPEYKSLLSWEHQGEQCHLVLGEDGGPRLAVAGTLIVPPSRFGIYGAIALLARLAPLAPLLDPEWKPSEEGMAALPLRVKELIVESAENFEMLRAQLAEAQAENGRLRKTVVLCAIPLEALHATELDGMALSDEVKTGISEAVEAAREAVNPKATQGETNG